MGLPGTRPGAPARRSCMQPKRARDAVTIVAAKVCQLAWPPQQLLYQASGEPRPRCTGNPEPMLSSLPLECSSRRSKGGSVRQVWETETGESHLRFQGYERLSSSLAVHFAFQASKQGDRSGSTGILNVPSHRTALASPPPRVHVREAFCWEVTSSLAPFFPLIVVYKTSSPSVSAAHVFQTRRLGVFLSCPSSSVDRLDKLVRTIAN